jgi:transposase-like protein
MKAYSLDLREKIVEYVKKGVSKSETARRFGVHRATVKRYCKRLDEHDTLQPRKAPGKGTEAGREGEEAPFRRPPREAVGHPLPEGRVPVRHAGSEGERSDGLPSSRTSV